VQIVDQQQQRAPVGEVRKQPIQSVHLAEEIPAGGWLVRKPKQRADMACSAGENQALLGLGHAADCGLEQLAHDPERHLALELATPCCERGDTGVMGKLGSPLEQRGFAETGSRQHEREASSSAASIGKPVTDQSQLPLTFQQPRLRPVDPRRRLRDYLSCPIQRSDYRPRRGSCLVHTLDDRSLGIAASLGSINRVRWSISAGRIDQGRQRQPTAKRGRVGSGFDQRALNRVITPIELDDQLGRGGVRFCHGADTDEQLWRSH
jgi:hypothetical protein